MGVGDFRQACQKKFPEQVYVSPLSIQVLYAVALKGLIVTPSSIVIAGAVSMSLNRGCALMVSILFSMSELSAEPTTLLTGALTAAALAFVVCLRGIGRKFRIGHPTEQPTAKHSNG